MLMSDFLMTRKSVRNFKNKDIKGDDVETIKALIVKSNEMLKDASFIFFEDGKKIAKALDGKAGYGGVMIEAPSYIGLHTVKESPENLLEGAYYIEKLISDLRNLGLGSCWVTLSRAEDVDHKGIFGVQEGCVKFLLAIGYPPREFLFGQSSAPAPKIGVEEFVFKGELGKKMEMDELENLGLADIFYFTRMAPSSHNKQPWRFVIKDSKLEFYLEDVETLDDYVDAGIVRYYFDALAGTTGIKTNWEMDIKDLDGKYTYLGQTSI